MTKWVGTSLLPSNLSLKLGSVLNFFGPKITNSVFFTLRLSLFAFNQFERFNKSLFTCFDNFSSNGLDCIMLVWSAKWCVFENLMLLWRLFKQIRKMDEPRINPWRIHVNIYWLRTYYFLYWQNCFLSSRYEQNHSMSSAPYAIVVEFS